MVHCEAIPEAHSGESGGAAPHDLGAGRGPSWAVDVTADPRHDEDGGGEGFGGPDAVLGSECAQHPGLEFGEHDVGRQVGLVGG